MTHLHNLLREGRSYTFINPYSFLILRKLNKDYLNSGCFQFFLDGFFLVWVLKLLGLRNIERMSFDDSSLAPYIFEYCKNNNKTIALIGSAPGVTSDAKLILERRYPGLKIEFFENGFFDSSCEKNVIEQTLSCDFVICSMGTPRQEDFLIKLRDLGWKGTGYTCGGYLDQLVEAKGSNYYPYLIDKFNLRWLYRIYKEPRRLFLRYLLDYPKGIILFIYDYLFKRIDKNIFIG